MAIDYSVLALPKGKPAAQEKAERTKTRKTSDEKENKKVKERSGGRCEVKWFGKKQRRIKRCERRSAPGVHHMIGGWGKRARGPSLLATHKQDVCLECHKLITSHVLRRVGGDVPLWDDEYERVDK